MSNHIPAARLRRAEPLSEALEGFDHAAWDVLCRRMQVLVINERRDLACKLLNQFAARHYPEVVKLDDHVAAFLPVRISEALEKHGYKTFRSVRNASDKELLVIGNFGTKTLDHLRAVIAKIERGELIDLPDEPLEQLYDRTKKEGK